MAMIGTLIKRLLGISTISCLLVFAIYWFELDEMFLKAFEPVFRKISDWVKG